MSFLHFADPRWAWALWAWLGLAGLLFWLERRGSGALERLVAPGLRGQLLRRPSGARRRLRLLFLASAGACMIVALMRPQWGLRHIATPRVGAEIMICLDVSKSMLADDVAPSRLERAKAELADLLTYLDGNDVGLIAFAGRATVLSPLTPDFSFLRLVLDGAGPGSVTRGGTRLEEPIRRAVAGFGPPGPAQRAILLITDGEDHESFPLDAAKQAAEAGIRIIAIGFGDEAGSEVFVSDPRTGARTQLRDADGKPVVSRLDGDLLRQIALATQGAYVPAGTSALDLKSIYAEHIARLTRGELDPHGRTLRDEGYQWCVLAALVFLVASVAIASGSRAGPARLAVALLAGLLAISLPGAVRAAEPVPPTAPPTAAPSTAPAPAPEPGGEATPRELYNQGSAALAKGELDTAESFLRRARSEAGADAELRQAASYNLGVTAFQRAAAREKEAPQEALAALRESASWFREALPPHGDDPAARHNLEVSLRKALLLADAIARGQEGGLEQRLARLATAQRARVAATAELLERVAVEGDLNAPDSLRAEFRSHADAQRALLAEADEVAEAAGRERDAIDVKPEAERKPAERMRSQQLGHVLEHLDRARASLGQARQQLRQRQAERAYRRASAGLAELERARDQLRDPLALLDALVGDVQQLAAQTGLLAAARRQLPGLAEPPAAPAWLGLAGLRESQETSAERVGELRARLEAGLQSQSAAPQQAGAAALLAEVAEAAPFVSSADTHMKQAGIDLAGERLAEAMASQREAALALMDARERFLDLRGLIEAARAQQQRIAALLGDDEETREARDEFLPSLRDAQAKNLARGERLDRKLQQEETAVRSAQAAKPQEGSSSKAEDPSAELERLATASQHLTLALAGMDTVKRELGDADLPAARVGWKSAQTGAETALEHLDVLRRLFFSVTEQLRDLSRRQLELNDATQDAVALAAPAAPQETPAKPDAAAKSGSAPEQTGAPPSEPPRPDAAPQAAEPEVGAEGRGREQIAPLVPRQESLAETAGGIGDALAEQAQQAAEPEPGQGEPGQGEPGQAPEPAKQDEPAKQREQASLRLREAGEHVVEAQLAMQSAAHALSDPASAPADARPHQDTALEELDKALALLEPPQPQQNPQSQQKQDQQKKEGGGQAGRDQKSGQRQQAQAEPDPAQLLQAVREREAARQRQRQQRSQAGYDPVEKDW